MNLAQSFRTNIVCYKVLYAKTAKNIGPFDLECTRKLNKSLTNDFIKVKTL